MSLMARKRKQSDGVRQIPCRKSACQGKKCSHKRYEARWSQDGKLRGKSFPTKTDAKAFLTQKKAEVARGDAPDPTVGRTLFADFARRWLAEVDVRTYTHENYKSIVESRLIPLLGGKPIGDIKPADLIALIKAMKAEGRARQTIKNNYGVVKQIIDEAVLLEAIPANPARNAALLRRYLPKNGDNGHAAEEEMTFLSAPEVKAIAEHMGGHNPQYLSFVYVAVDSGCRFGEMVGLRVSDFDPKSGVLTIRTSATMAYGEWEDNAPKNNKTRKVRLSPFTAKLLAEQVEGRELDDLIFTSPRLGDYLRHSTFRYVLGRAVETVLPEAKHGLRVHDLRHTCASLMRAAGASIYEVSARLGHGDIGITQRTYTHLFPNHDEDIAERFNDLWTADDDNEEAA